MNLDEFMMDRNTRNAWLEEPGWKALYVRKSVRWFGGVKYDSVIDLANIEAEHRDVGTFQKLIERIRHTYINCTIYIENVGSPRFAFHLSHCGFTRIDSGGFPSFYLRPVDLYAPRNPFKSLGQAKT